MELNRNESGLVTFAVPEESHPFLRAWGDATASRPTREGSACWRFDDLDVLVTGMGSRNAETSVERFLVDHHPRWIVTAGFAGGLDPGLPRGTVGISNDPGFLGIALAHGSRLRPMSFHESRRVIQTTAAKAELHRASACHAVDMESQTIRRISLARGIPSATIRVVSDDASEDLPLDFGALMGPDDRIDWVRLALTLLGSPSLIPRLIRFQGRLRPCADSLARALVDVLGMLHRPATITAPDRAGPPINRAISN
ncbi:MAG: hypothetical protein FJ379_02975 [Verrucomicrobia bacterium]|nr:hypothetical protein [Verrucomicrobiota bacterium]